ncbi:MAG: MurNAc alpha-1-phosphate uridylyltransferase [Candidatus Endobugula sp.]|jgi:MurNAc alpha-1-phosphate uridylyltransferase
MKAMILAAGRGERMRPLTDRMPKPLLSVGGKPLIVYHLERLSVLGISEVIINVAYLGDKIRQALGDGSQWNLSIHYSEEPYPLETGGALNNALGLLGTEPFLLINGDVWCDIDFTLIANSDLCGGVGHLWFVKNPEHNVYGDFSLDDSCVNLKRDNIPSLTFSGLALIHPDIISTYPEKREVFALKEVFLHFIDEKKLQGSLFLGSWCDVGTPERLQALDGLLRK